MVSSVIVSGRYIAWYDPCSGHRSHNHFSNKNWKFIAVTSDLQCVLIFSNVRNDSSQLLLLPLGADTVCWTTPSGAERQWHFTFQQCASTGATALSSRNALFKEKYKLFSQKKGGKKCSPVHTQVDPTRHDGEFMHHLVLNIRGFSIPWHTSTPPSKSLDKFRCVFICFFGRCAAESDRQTWISLAERPRPC